MSRKNVRDNKLSKALEEDLVNLFEKHGILKADMQFVDMQMAMAGDVFNGRKCISFEVQSSSGLSIVDELKSIVEFANMEVPAVKH